MKDSALEPINSAAQAVRYLRYALEFREVVRMIHASSLEAPMEATLRTIDPETFRVELQPLGHKVDKWSVGDRVRLSFPVHESLFLSNAFVRSTDELLGLELLPPLMKLQRRDALRIKVNSADTATLAIDGHIYVPHDISASGISLVVDNHTAFIFMEKGTCDGRLHFAGRSIDLVMTPVQKSALSINRPHLSKVGYRFKKLSHEADRFLSKEAYLYSHRIWSRWL
jgi:hypothetical protein